MLVGFCRGGNVPVSHDVDNDGDDDVDDVDDGGDGGGEEDGGIVYCVWSG